MQFGIRKMFALQRVLCPSVVGQGFFVFIAYVLVHTVYKCSKCNLIWKKKAQKLYITTTAGAENDCKISITVVPTWLSAAGTSQKVRSLI